MSYCDGEWCEVCEQWTTEGNDELGRCITCGSETSSLEHLLRSMASGVTRDRLSGRFVSIRKE